MNSFPHSGSEWSGNKIGDNKNQVHRIWGQKARGTLRDFGLAMFKNLTQIKVNVRTEWMESVVVCSFVALLADC